jgi:hypothetical protein
MAEHSLDEKTAALIESAIAYADKEPIFSLLLCRQAAESFLMKKHLEMIGDGDPKEVLTLGDAFSNQLGLKDIFNPLEKMSIQYIQQATNPFLHFRIEPLEIRNDLIPRVLQEIYSLTGKGGGNFEVNKSNKILNTSEKVKDWRTVLKEELDNFNWPVELEGSVLETRVLKDKLKTEEAQLFGITRSYSNANIMTKNVSVMNVKDLKKQLSDLGLKVNGKKSELRERLTTKYERIAEIERKHIDIKKHSISELNKLISLTNEERIMLLKEATEAGLIALYNKAGNRKLKESNNLSKSLYIAFMTAANAKLPDTIVRKNKTMRKHWKFLIQNQGKYAKSGTLIHEWNFFNY